MVGVGGDFTCSGLRNSWVIKKQGGEHTDKGDRHMCKGGYRHRHKSEIRPMHKGGGADTQTRARMEKYKGWEVHIEVVPTK